MPGLLRGVARTAAIAGTATAVSNRVSRRQANRWAAKQEQQAPPPQQQYAQPPQQYAPPPQQYAPAPQQYAEPAPGVPAPDPIAQLERLGQLKASGVLTAEEFAAEKAKILSST